VLNENFTYDVQVWIAAIDFRALFGC